MVVAEVFSERDLSIEGGTPVGPECPFPVRGELKV